MVGLHWDLLGALAASECSHALDVPAATCPLHRRFQCLLGAVVLHFLFPLSLRLDSEGIDLLTNLLLVSGGAVRLDGRGDC